MEIVTIHASEKRTRRNGHVDWKILLALETLDGFLDGHVAEVRPERRAKNKSVSCKTWLRGMLKD